MNCLYHIALLLTLLLPTTIASGAVELVVTSPDATVIVETTVCADFQCSAPDDNSPARKVSAGAPLRFQTGVYQGEARESIDLFVKVNDLKNNAITRHFRPPTSTSWNTVVVELPTTNVTVQLRNSCAPNYHGERCGHFCVVSKDRHWECSSDGRRQCSAGWTGSDCSIPVCSAGCNGNGRCVGPEKCECAAGFNGTQCSECIPSDGCVNGGCRNGIPKTCECLPGFVGAKCDIDVNICRHQKPCRNNGVCSLDTTTSSGFRCDCPVDFFGARCETPLSSVRCANNAEHVCRNGGICISMEPSSFQCQCPRGFSGRFCELGEHKDCSTKRCSSPGATCQMIGAVPMCVEPMASSVRPPAVLVINNHHHYPAPAQKESDELWDNWLFLICALSCIVGVLLATRLVYTKFIAESSRRRLAASESPLPTTVATPTKPAAYKVCIIDAERGAASEPTSHSPPPAYTSPVIPRLYKSIPTHDLENLENQNRLNQKTSSSSYRDSNV